MLSGSAALAQTALHVSVKGCEQLDPKVFEELLTLELGTPDVSAEIIVLCSADLTRVEAHSRDGRRNATRIVRGVFKEADPTRVLALAASELFEVRWNRLVVKDEPPMGESETIA